ncbi:MAG: dihydrodipicolinate synthase family protein [Bacteroidales bacterium]|nr:dihydrodipicolinate synthase family protein [Bacteroidales bacterium]MBN2698279.1 dihydrodipicolinate synthase family protein [Bacteroidales bacterium]
MDTIANIEGIITPIVTPLKGTDELDVTGLEKLVEHVIAGGVSGIFVLGTTGEFSGLSYRLRKELVERICRQVDGRIRVLVGITDTAFIESVNMAEKAYSSGADALVAAPPYYYPTGQPELIEYYDRLLKQLSLPLFLYNMPLHTKTILEPNTVSAIAVNEKVAGLKDSSANMVYFRSLQYAMKDHPGFRLFIGPEEIMADAVLLGANGGVNGGSNLFPGLYVELYRAAKLRDFERLELLQKKVLQISAMIYSVGRYGSSYLKGLKCALSLMGICDDYMTEPFHRFKKEEREKISEALKTINEGLAR